MKRFEDTENNYDEFGDGEYYEEAGDGEYYEEAGDGEYYEETGDGEYYEETGDGEYYEEFGDGEYYEETGDGEYYEETGDGEYYEEFGDGEYYEDVEYYEDDDLTYDGAGDGFSILKGFWQKFGELETAERVMVYMGVAVLLLAIVSGIVFVRVKLGGQRLSGFASVGAQIEGIEVVGDRGLLALADVLAANAQAEELPPEEEPEQPEEPKEYEENEYSQKVTVVLKTVSVQRDLKIKFINKSTDKLISNTPFSLTVKTANEDTETWYDDDKDGIIYKKDITPGIYKVTVNALEGSAYAGYTLPEGAEEAEVKKDIAYEKIDVSDEVKTESQIDVANEEQKKEELTVESVLTDTVKWVPSTVVEGGYTEIKKKKVEDPTPDAAGTVRPSVTPGDALGLSQENAEAGTVEETVYIGSPISVKFTTANMPADAVMKAKSSDKEVATVSVSGQTVTINGLSEGAASITVRFVDGDEELARAEWDISVDTHPKSDTATALMSTDGKQLYVQDGDNYREAVYADYYRDGVKFYKRSAAKYTGWQTIDGNLYFYDENHNKVTGEQVIQGAKYNFASDGSLVAGSGTMGIDVSKHNGNIDWNAVKNSGVSYVIIRCGYRGYTQGALVEDPTFRQNIKGATGVGLKVGVYFFSQAVDEVEAVEEASFVLEAVKGYKISYPVFLDVESSGAPGNRGRADGLDRNTRTAVCKAFCATIRSGGYTAGIYANKTWLENKIDPGQLSAYKIWLAQYAAQPTYAGRFDMWQYQSSGQVSGINGRVDMNISYLGY